VRLHFSTAGVKWHRSPAVETVAICEFPEKPLVFLGDFPYTPKSVTVREFAKDSCLADEPLDKLVLA
jgi:hypothetical protein